MPPSDRIIFSVMASALLHTVCAASYFPRYWPENSPASVTVIGSAFRNSASYSLSLGGSPCADVLVLSENELVCTTSQTSGTDMALGNFSQSIPPRVIVDLSKQLGIKTPPFGQAWKFSFLPATSEIVFNLNCRMKDGKVLVNENSGFLECSSIDISDWGQGSVSYKFLYSSLPLALSLADPELITRITSDAFAAKLTIKILTAPGSSGDGAAAAKKLVEMFASGQFHAKFGRIFNSVYGRSLLLDVLLKRIFCFCFVNVLMRLSRVYGGQKTPLKLSGLDETLPGEHIFLIYLGSLALVVVLWWGLRWYKRHMKGSNLKKEQRQKDSVSKKSDADADDATAGNAKPSRSV
jgi:hypothetical protein